MYLGVSLFHFQKIVLLEIKFLIDIFCSFRAVNMLSHCFFTSIVSDYKSNKFWGGSLICDKSSFSCCFKFFSLCLSFGSFTIICLCVKLFVSSTWSLLSSDLCRLTFFIRFGKFPAILSLTSIFFFYFSLVS